MEDGTRFCSSTRRWPRRAHLSGFFSSTETLQPLRWRQMVEAIRSATRQDRSLTLDARVPTSPGTAIAIVNRKNIGHPIVSAHFPAGATMMRSAAS